MALDSRTVEVRRMGTPAIVTSLYVETNLTHHHGHELIPMERLGDYPAPEKYGAGGWGQAATYVCTKCGQKVTLDLVGGFQRSERDSDELEPVVGTQPQRE
jgi:hypothetical protein